MILFLKPNARHKRPSERGTAHEVHVSGGLVMHFLLHICSLKEYVELYYARLSYF
jgi:hypothetical protein